MARNGYQIGDDDLKTAWLVFPSTNTTPILPIDNRIEHLYFFPRENAIKENKTPKEQQICLGFPGAIIGYIRKLLLESWVLMQLPCNNSHDCQHLEIQAVVDNSVAKSFVANMVASAPMPGRHL